MDAQKKKLVLAGLAVVVLGAGYFLFGGTSSEQNQAPTLGVTERKKSNKPETSTATRREAPRSRETREAPVAAERKEREEVDTGTAERKRRRTDKKEEQRKKIAPAA